MGLFNFSKRPAATNAADAFTISPYKDSATNFIYNLLFCDDAALYKKNMEEPLSYPYDILFAEPGNATDVQKIIADKTLDTRLRILACNRQISLGHTPAQKELMAVIVEVGLENGLDVLASFNDGTARYINQTGRLLVWETTDDTVANALTADLFQKSAHIVSQIGPWDKPRRPQPSKGNVRITFLVSDGLYFDEAPINMLFNDTMAGPALSAATSLMQYLTEKSLEAK